MAADQPGSFKRPVAGPRGRESRPTAPGAAEGQDRFSGQIIRPPLVGTDSLPALVEMVKLDLSREWLLGRPVTLESYLDSFPELGTAETVAAELILAEYVVRCRSGERVALAQFDHRFPHQAAALRRLIEEHTGEAASGSMLGQLGELTARMHNRPLSLAADAKAAPALPRRFGRYRVLEQLGQGAMGTVYLVRDTQLNRQVALKVPHVRTSDVDAMPDRRILDRFYREAHAAAILRHPNLCPVYDVGQIDGVPYLTMAYIRGRPLSRYIERDRPLSPRWTAVLVRKLALALQAAHEKGVIHRDIKPSNVMICASREPVIMDFGLAWRLDCREANERLTRIGLVLGTPAYMSPEQLSGQVEDLGPRCDVYSLGVILYELLTGRCPFQGPEAVVLGQVLFVEPERPSSVRPELDPRLEAICLKAMAKRDLERYSTMRELAAAVGAYLRHRAAPLQSSSITVATDPLPASNDAQPREVGAADEPESSRGEGRSDGRSADEVVEVPVAILAPAGLLKSWRRWTATVATFALGRRSRRFRDPRAFTTLRNELLATLRARAAETEGPERGFYLTLEGVISPWVHLRSLARQDREILGDLLARCRQIERILKHRSPRITAGAMVATVSFVLAVAAALVCWGLVFK
jgi:serine/threonine protein kinase